MLNMDKIIDQVKSQFRGKDLAIAMSRRDYIATLIFKEMVTSRQVTYYDDDDNELTPFEASVYRADLLIKELDSTNDETKTS